VWWSLNKEKYKHLYFIAHTLLSLAPTEAAVERSFSKQKFIHSDRRNRAGDDLIEAQMMIAFNDAGKYLYHNTTIKLQFLTFLQCFVL
jgi:hypothetical protein